MAFVPFLVRGTRTRLIYHLRLPNVSEAAGRPTTRGRVLTVVPLFLAPFVLLSLTSPVIPRRSPMFFLSVQSFRVPLVLGRPLAAHSSTLVVTARLIEAGA
jgi:hypothetical protein